MATVDSSKLPRLEPPADLQPPAYNVGGFRPPGPTFRDWVAEAEYLAATPPGVGMPQELIGQPKAVYLRMKLAEAMDIPVMIAIQDMYIIGDKVGTSAALIRALMLRAGHQFWFPKTEPDICLMRLRRAGEQQAYEVIYTWEEAEAAGLTSSAKTGDTWQRHPADCLVAAATRRMGRRHTADVTRGYGYGRDELALAQDHTPFALNGAALAAQVAEVVDEAAAAATLPELTRVCHDASDRALMNQVTAEDGPGHGETLRLFLLQCWNDLEGDPAAAPRAPATPAKAAAPRGTAVQVRTGPPDTWLHSDCGRCRIMTVLANGDHDPDCPQRTAPVKENR